MSDWYALNHAQITAGPGRKYVGYLPPHGERRSTLNDRIPYVSVVGSTPMFGGERESWVAGAEDGPAYPNPSPHAADQPYINFLQTTTWPEITMNEWYEAKIQAGISVVHEFYMKRHLRGKHLGAERMPVTHVDMHIASKYVVAAQSILDTYFNGRILKTSCTVELIPTDTKRYNNMTRAYANSVRHVISLHPMYLSNADDYSILMTLLHEIAHIIRPLVDDKYQEESGHDWFWQQICIHIGGDGLVYDAVFESSEHVLKRSYVFTCTQPDKTKATCMFHIPKRKYTYDDRYSDLVCEGGSSTCTRHGASFQRTFWDDSSRPATLFKWDDGIVEFMMEAIEFNAVKSAILKLVVEVMAGMKPRATGPVSSKKSRMEPNSDMGKLQVRVQSIHDAKDMATLYAVTRVTRDMCINYIHAYSGDLSHPAYWAYEAEMDALI